VRRWLERHDRWLLILDNARAPQAATGLQPPLAQLVDLLPQVLHGQLVVTTRDAAWGEETDLLELELLTPEEGVQFLLTRADSSDQPAAAEVATLLGLLPLALEQAGAYARSTRISLAVYLDRLRHHPGLALTRGRPRHRDPADTVATTWQLSLDNVHELPGAAPLLELCAFLAPDNIPRDLFLHDVDTPPEWLGALADDPFTLDEAVAALHRYGLIKADEQSLSMHRLLQQVVRDSLDLAATVNLVGLAVRLLVSAFPPVSESEPRSWPASERLLPHVLVAAEHAQRHATQRADTGRLLDRAASYLHGRGRYLEAEDLFKRALAVSEEIYGPQDVRVGAQLNHLAATWRELRLLDHALAHHERALALLEAASGTDHPDVAQTLASIGLVQYRRGEHHRARSAYQRALKIFQARADRLQAARTLSSLGMALKGLGRFDAAETSIRQALTLFEQCGADDWQIASALDNLGTILSAAGRLQEARAALEQARGILERRLGPDHPEVAWTWNHLGDVRYRLGDLDGARVAYEQAVSIRAATLPPDHPGLLESRQRRDHVLRDLACREQTSSPAGNGHG